MRGRLRLPRVDVPIDVLRLIDSEMERHAMVTGQEILLSCRIAQFGAVCLDALPSPGSALLRSLAHIADEWAGGVMGRTSGPSGSARQPVHDVPSPPAPGSPRGPARRTRAA